MSKTTRALTILCVGLLAVGAIAAPALAKPGEDDGDDRRADAKSHMENRTADREDRRERMRDAHDAWQACKRENATANESMQQRCGDEKSYFLNATKARREARALVGAIEALERRLGRLEAREIALEDRLESGNLSANETARVEAQIEKIDSHQERMAERLQHLQERLEALMGKWQSARDHVAEHRHGDDEDEEEDDEAESESESQTSTAAA